MLLVWQKYEGMAYVLDNAMQSTSDLILKKGKSVEIYNVGAGNEK